MALLDALILLGEPLRVSFAVHQHGLRLPSSALTIWCGIYKAREEARQGVFDHVEMFCNPVREQVRNGMLSPVEFERQHILKWKASRNPGAYSTPEFHSPNNARPYAIPLVSGGHAPRHGAVGR